MTLWGKYVELHDMLSLYDFPLNSSTLLDIALSCFTCTSRILHIYSTYISHVLHIYFTYISLLFRHVTSHGQRLHSGHSAAFQFRHMTSRCIHTSCHRNHSCANVKKERAGKRKSWRFARLHQTCHRTVSSTRHSNPPPPNLASAVSSTLVRLRHRSPAFAQHPAHARRCHRSLDMYSAAAACTAPCMAPLARLPAKLRHCFVSSSSSGSSLHRTPHSGQCLAQHFGRTSPWS